MITKMSKDECITLLGNDQMRTCESCLMGKIFKSPFTRKKERDKEILGLIHNDVCGPIFTAWEEASRIKLH